MEIAYHAPVLNVYQGPMADSYMLLLGKHIIEMIMHFRDFSMYLLNIHPQLMEPE